jgi:uncharacterized protein (TIGR02172 family)
MDVEQLGKRITRGSTAEIYEWQPGRILKLFNENCSKQEVRHEFHIAKAVQVMDSVPRVHDMIQVGRHWGIIYQHFQGTPLAEALRHDVSKASHFAKHFAGLHARIHAVSDVAELPSQLERLKKKILATSLLTPTLQQNVIAHLESLPTARTLCHGDFHPGNVLVEKDKFFVIDWADATLGHPLADVTRTTLILEGLAATEPSLATFVNNFKTAYLENYFALRPGSEKDLEPWRPVIAAARLRENIHQNWLLEQVSLGMAKISNLYRVAV